MRDQLRATVRGLLEHLPGSVYDKAEIRQPVIALAKYVALARSPVDRDNQGEIGWGWSLKPRHASSRC